MLGESTLCPRALRITRPHCSPALTTEGIFRRSANTQVVREVQQKYNMGEWFGEVPRPTASYRPHVGAGGGGGELGACVRLLGASLPFDACKQGSQIPFLAEVLWHLV